MSACHGSDCPSKNGVIRDMDAGNKDNESFSLHAIDITITGDSDDNLDNVTAEDASYGMACYTKPGSNERIIEDCSTDRESCHSDDSAWSDVDSDIGNEDDSAASFVNFARNHSTHVLFDENKNDTRRILPKSLMAKLTRKSSQRKKSTCESAPHSPRAPKCTSEWPEDAKTSSTTSKLTATQSTGNMQILLQSTPRDVAVVYARSRSLENHSRLRIDDPRNSTDPTDKKQLQVRPERKLSFKQKLFGSTSSLNKIPHHLPRRKPPRAECDSAGKIDNLIATDQHTARTPSPVLKFLKHGANPGLKKLTSKGHVNAEEEFMWKNSSTDRNNLDSVSRSGGVPTIATASQSAGTLVQESVVQPTSASPLTIGIDMSAAGNYDAVDGNSSAVNDLQRTRQLAEHLKQKIIKTSEAIKQEQSTKDDNVTEYLKLSTNADKQQAARIKSVFEKKNQKSNATISQLQKKLDGYHRRLKEIDSNGGGRQGRLRDVGANIRDFSGGVVDSVKGGLSGLQQATQNAAGAIVNKPKDFASKFKNRFGSADNLAALKDDDYEDDHLRYGSADDVSSTSGSIDNFVSVGSNLPGLDETPNIGRASVVSAPDSPSYGVGRRVDAQQVQVLASHLVSLKAELQECRRSQAHMESEMDLWKRQVQDEHNLLTNSLQEERFRYERLETQLNDLTELHQREISRLNQELTSMEEKVEYHAHERARDVQEAIESCQTRIAKMELQQQQLVSVEGLENATARALLGKLINLLLSVLAVLLVLVSTVYGLLMPFMRSQARIISTLTMILAVVVMYKNWDVIHVWVSSVGR